MKSDEQLLNDLLAKLHVETAQGLLDLIRSPDAKAADFKAALTMLKDNDITARPTGDSPLLELAASFEGFGDNDEDAA